MRDAMRNEVALARERLVGDRNLFSVSEMFHENSKIIEAAPRFAVSAESIAVAPDGFKRYLHAARVTLPKPQTSGKVPLIDAVLRRRSCRHYSGTPIGLGDLSDLLFLTAGTQDGDRRRCHPSAGGLYPLEFYVASSRVNDLKAGLYHYAPRAHELVLCREGDQIEAVGDATFVAEALMGAAAVVLITAVFGRSKIKYGERAYRFALIEAGHAAQNLCLASTALGFGSCPVGGFIDDKLSDILNVDGVEEAPLYATIVGSAAPG